MNLLKQVWSDLPSGVLIGAMYFGVLPAVLEWLNHA